MKKLTRKSLEELRMELPVVEHDQLMQYIAGYDTSYTIDIDDIIVRGNYNGNSISETQMLYLRSWMSSFGSYMPKDELESYLNESLYPSGYVDPGQSGGSSGDSSSGTTNKYGKEGRYPIQGIVDYPLNVTQAEQLLEDFASHSKNKSANLAFDLGIHPAVGAVRYMPSLPPLVYEDITIYCITINCMQPNTNQTVDCNIRSRHYVGQDGNLPERFTYDFGGSVTGGTPTMSITVKGTDAMKFEKIFSY